MGIHDGADGRLNVFHLGDVAGNGHAANFASQPFELVNMATTHCNSCAFLSKAPRDYLAHVAAPCRTQHISHLAC